MERRNVPTGEEFEGRAGTVTITCPMPGVILLRMSGNVTKDIVPPLIARLDRMFAENPVSTAYFYDLWEMRSYDSELRVDLTNWHLKHRDTLKVLHAVSSSKLVRMGVTVANVALGKIVQHDEPRQFEVALGRITKSRVSA